MNQESISPNLELQFPMGGWSNAHWYEERSSGPEESHLHTVWDNRSLGKSNFSLICLWNVIERRECCISTRKPTWQKSCIDSRWRIEKKVPLHFILRPNYTMELMLTRVPIYTPIREPRKLNLYSYYKTTRYRVCSQTCQTFCSKFINFTLASGKEITEIYSSANRTPSKVGSWTKQASKQANSLVLRV